MDLNPSRSPSIFISKVFRYRSMIALLVIRSIQSRYAGTSFGFLWSIINPLAMTIVYWFVFSVGFKVKPSGEIPFVLVFFCGLIPWTLFNEFLTINTNTILKNPHLVKKTIFPTEILALVDLFTVWVNQAVMLILLCALMMANGVAFSPYNLQFIYYLLALSAFCLGLGWLLSALNVFYRDVGHILGVILNLWFWLTPIVWMKDMIPAKYHFFIKLNPIFYIVEGYKSSFIYHVPFWSDLGLGVYFWSLAVFFLAIGGTAFKRLKPEFAEVL